MISYKPATLGGLIAYSCAQNPDGQEAEMAYERLNAALQQLKTDRERQEATEKQRIEAGTEARMRFARIKSAVIEPIFNEVVALIAAEGFFGETVDEPNDGSAPISLNLNLSEDEGSIRQGSLQVRFNHGSKAEIDFLDCRDLGNLAAAELPENWRRAAR